MERIFAPIDYPEGSWMGVGDGYCSTEVLVTHEWLRSWSLPDFDVARESWRVLSDEHVSNVFF